MISLNSYQIANYARLNRSSANLLHISQSNTRHYQLGDLVDLLPSDAVLVINNAATIPAAFSLDIDSQPIEIRLVRNLGTSWNTVQDWIVLVLGSGTWRQRTEDRGSVPDLAVGQQLSFGTIAASITAKLDRNGRLYKLHFHGTDQQIWDMIYQLGSPIQYSHLDHELDLWNVQTVFASHPVAVEPPSASFQFSWDLVNRLIRQGVSIVPITHATTISSTGLPELDRCLPFPERYAISRQVAEQINRSYEDYKPIVAVGTSVVRALEDNYTRFSQLRSGHYLTDLKISRGYHRKLVDHLITGMHLPQESHMQMLRNFVDDDMLTRAYSEAIELGYLWHEYGDVSFIESDK